MCLRNYSHTHSHIHGWMGRRGGGEGRGFETGVHCGTRSISYSYNVIAYLPHRSVTKDPSNETAWAELSVTCMDYGHL